MKRGYVGPARGIVIFILGAGLFGCTGRMPRSLGPLREVTVITDHWPRVENTVKGILCREIPTPQPEPEFKLRVGGSDRFAALSRLRVVFLIGTVEDTLLRRIMGSKLDSLPEGDGALFKFPNAWVDNQWVLLFVARDTGRLVSGLELYARRIHQTVTEFVLQQMARATYLEGVNKDLTTRLEERYGWRLDVPPRWLLEEKDSAARFVYIHTHYPDRSIFVHWQDRVVALEPERLLALRDRLTGRFYEGDSVERGSVLVDTIEFLGVRTVRMRGVWQNRRLVIGGPFVCYALNYQERFFMLDGMVFNPGEKKLSNLFQVEAVLRSFLPAGVLRGAAGKPDTSGRVFRPTEGSAG